MRIISRKVLREVLETPRYRDSEYQLREWEIEVKKAKWKNPIDVKQTYGTASILKNNHVVFNIKGDTYRLIVRVNYRHSIVYIRFIGTHKQYDQINAEEI